MVGTWNITDVLHIECTVQPTHKTTRLFFWKGGSFNNQKHNDGGEEANANGGKAQDYLTIFLPPYDVELDSLV